MKNYPRLTIVTPSYNQAPFLEETIRSVLDQDYPDVEYLVIDGGSTDGSREIITRYENRLSGWISEPDRGQADAVNKGMTRASGDIVAWINSDDYYLPGAFRAAVDSLMEEPEYGMVFGNVLAVDGNGQEINHLRYARYTLDDLMRFKIIGQPAVFMRRKAFEEAGKLDLSYQLLLDHHLWLRIAINHPLKYIDQYLAAARFHPAAKNLAQAHKFGEEAYRIVQWMQTAPQFAGMVNKNFRQVWAGAHRLNGWYCSEGSCHREAIGSYWRGFLADPGIVFADWKRIIYSLFALAGLNIKPFYAAVKKTH